MILRYTLLSIAAAAALFATAYWAHADGTGSATSLRIAHSAPPPQAAATSCAAATESDVCAMDLDGSEVCVPAKADCG